MEAYRVSIIGGDLRSIKLAALLAADGNNVHTFGFKDFKYDISLFESYDLKQTLEGSQIVIGPVPFSVDNDTVNSPFHTEKIHINDVLKNMEKNQLLIAGRIDEKIKRLAKVYDINLVDILEREEMAVLNAIPTAEGAIQIAMEDLDITLHDSNSLVLGFGRIGKVLSKMLLGIGANVHVGARKCKDIACIRSYGYTPVLLSDLKKNLEQMQVIFNTIPSMILDKELLSILNKECLIIDLASKPGGVNFEEASKLGINAKWALSLPGKVAPVTAAGFIKDTIYNIVGELGV